MTTNPADGHLTAEEMDGVPLRRFLLGNLRIAVQADNAVWIARLKRIGAAEVNERIYGLADALRVDGRSE